MKRIVGRLLIFGFPVSVCDDAIGTARPMTPMTRSPTAHTTWCSRRPSWACPRYFHVTSIPKKCMKTSRFGLFFGFCCGLRM